jgi:hypothetical protein
MRTLDALNWINRRGAPLAVLPLLFGVGALTHQMALAVLKMADPQLPGADAPGDARLRFIAYVDAHLRIPLPFVALFAAFVATLTGPGDMTTTLSRREGAHGGAACPGRSAV